MIKGNIDILTQKKVSGWVKNIDNNQACDVRLVINNKIVEVFTADEFRPDLKKKKIHPTGRCGFNVSIEKYKVDLTSDQVFIEPIIRLAKLSKQDKPKLEPKKAAIEIKNQTPFFFLHIPKTAGTSFRRMLYNHFEDKFIYPNFSTLIFNGSKYPLYKEILIGLAKHNRPIHLFNGHYTIHQAQKIFKNFKTIVFLRDPVERTISLLYELKKAKNEFKNSSLEFIFDHSHNHVFNNQVYFLSGKTMPKDQNEEDLKIALTNLEAAYFVGFKNNFEADIKRLERESNWNLGEALTLNQTPKEKSEHISKSLKEKIKKSNVLDIKLYDYAKTLFLEKEKVGAI